MSKAYAKLSGWEEPSKTSEMMRAHCQRPGAHNEDGSIRYFTEQAHLQECDVNHIIRKYDKTGLITHLQKVEASFGDMTGLDFQKMQNQIANAKSMFAQFPSHIRKKFKNSPVQFLTFMENPDNRETAIKLGLIRKDSDPAKDGLGEHSLDTTAKKPKPPTNPEVPPSE